MGLVCDSGSRACEHARCLIRMSNPCAYTSQVGHGGKSGKSSDCAIVSIRLVLTKTSRGIISHCQTFPHCQFVPYCFYYARESTSLKSLSSSIRLNSFYTERCSPPSFFSFLPLDETTRRDRTITQSVTGSISRLTVLSLVVYLSFLGHVLVCCPTVLRTLNQYCFLILQLPSPSIL